MPKGLVKAFNEIRGEGIVETAEGNTVYINAELFRGAGYQTLSIGTPVEFELKRASSTPLANDLRPAGKLGFAPSPCPFNPQRATSDPSLFAGRVEQIRTALTTLYNGGNVFLLGDRGVGKSSLALQLADAAEGGTALLEHLFGATQEVVTSTEDSPEPHFDHIVAFYTCYKNQRLSDVVEGLAWGVLDPQKNGLHKSKRTFEFGFAALGLKALSTKEMEEVSPNDLTRALAEVVEAVYDEYDRFKGVVFFIDEANHIEDMDGFASFLRATSAMLEQRGYERVSFVVSGLSSFWRRMHRQDKSITRFFDVVEVPTMSSNELGEIIEKAMSASEKQMAPLAAEAITRRAERYPHPVHLLGYHAYQRDSDGIIDLDDVLAAEKYVIETLKRQEFADVYDELERDLEFLIVDLLATVDAASLSLDELVRATGEPRDQVSGKLGSLMRSEVVTRDIVGRRTTTYMIRDPLFRLYFRWIKVGWE